MSEQAVATAGWMVWSRDFDGWRAWPAGRTGDNGHTTAYHDAHVYTGLNEFELGTDDVIVPRAAMAAAMKTVPDRARPVAAFGSGDRFVDELAGILDTYMGLAAVRLDRHVTVSLCGWDYPCEGRTVADVFTDLLQHIRADHS